MCPYYKKVNAEHLNPSGLLRNGYSYFKIGKKLIWTSSLCCLETGGKMTQIGL